MKYLLDTHVLLWTLKGENSKGDILPAEIRSIILNPDNTIYYSAINIFEIEIKRIVRPQDGLPSGEAVVEFCRKAGFIQLQLSGRHALMMKSLKRSAAVEDHKDPYDWLLLSQAKSEGMKFITHDSKLRQYLEDCILAF